MPYVEVMKTQVFDPIYLAKSSDTTTYYCEPACFEYIKAVGKEECVEQIQWMEVMVPFERLASQPVRKDYRPTLNVPHLLQFPLNERDTPYLVSIFNFFNGLQKKQGKTLTEQLEYAVVAGNYPKVPKDVMARLVVFCFKQVIPKHERLRAAFSPHIQPFMNGDYLR